MLFVSDGMCMLCKAGSHSNQWEPFYCDDEQLIVACETSAKGYLLLTVHEHLSVVLLSACPNEQVGTGFEWALRIEKLSC